MPFKINVSHKGKTYKLESEDEFLIGKKIGEHIEGNELNLTQAEKVMLGQDVVARARDIQARE